MGPTACVPAHSILSLTSIRGRRRRRMRAGPPLVRGTEGVGRPTASPTRRWHTSVATGEKHITQQRISTRGAPHSRRGIKLENVRSSSLSEVRRSQHTLVEANIAHTQISGACSLTSLVPYFASYRVLSRNATTTRHIPLASQEPSGLSRRSFTGHRERPILKEFRHFPCFD